MSQQSRPPEQSSPTGPSLSPVVEIPLHEIPSPSSPQRASSSRSPRQQPPPSPVSETTNLSRHQTAARGLNQSSQTTSIPNSNSSSDHGRPHFPSPLYNSAAHRPIPMPTSHRQSPPLSRHTFSNAMRSQANRLSTSLHQARSRSQVLRAKTSKLFHGVYRTSSQYISIILATLLFILVSYIVLTSISSHLNSPLLKISPQLGTFLLTVLSKLTDYAFGSIANKVRQKIQWGPLLAKSSNMLTFFTMGSSVGGWWKVLLHRRRPSGERIVTANSVSSWSWTPRLLGLVNILIWGIIQLPGLVFMTVLNPSTYYEAVEWTPISGGLGVFDPNLIIQGYDNAKVTDIVTRILQDPAQSIETTPIDEVCKSSRSCSALLLTGGLNNISPWPYGQTKDPALTFYIVKDAPGYQVDVSVPDEGENLQFNPEYCALYGVDLNNAFQLCIAWYRDPPQQLVARWRACTESITPSGECSQPWPINATYMTTIAYSRVLATTTYDRLTDRIRNVEGIKDHKVEIISPYHITIAIDTLLCAIGSGSTLCQGSATNALFTSQIFLGLKFRAVPQGSYNTEYLNYLRNLLVAPLFVFNNSTGSAGGTSRPFINEPQPNLRAEYYINGSLAREYRYISPEAWTIYVYVSVAAFLLIAAWIVSVWAESYPRVQTSSFPFVDYLKLRWSLEQSEEWKDDLKLVFEGEGATSDSKVITVVVDKKMARKKTQVQP
ncbi:hypothetical protein BJ875DRAFT_488901 [Amylocarpus encephaloides]|uniref:Uncharacterized protein n=1 Tax=Amylocarpus encephaloides TaxID=45428 RepID=A0A9P8C0Q2_9HELO|nr:hypothetical protein BJ875DRAFT_488901 [Amylocarpus encephaloides]